MLLGFSLFCVFEEYVFGEKQIMNGLNWKYFSKMNSFLDFYLYFCG